MLSHQGHDAHRPFRAQIRIAILVFSLIAAVLLLSEHRVHALSLLPYLLLIACPLLHLLHRHGSHRDKARD